MENFCTPANYRPYLKQHFLSQCGREDNTGLNYHFISVAFYYVFSPYLLSPALQICLFLIHSALENLPPISQLNFCSPSP